MKEYDELKKEINTSKWAICLNYQTEYWQRNFLKNIKKFKKKIVLCHGAFDIVHIGHINHFKEAKKFGDILIVSLTDDSYIKKGPNQPYFKSIERANFLLSLKLVDFIYISPTETGEDPITLFKPDYYVKGIDYSNQSQDINLKKKN